MRCARYLLAAPDDPLFLQVKEARPSVLERSSGLKCVPRMNRGSTDQKPWSLRLGRDSRSRRQMKLLETAWAETRDWTEQDQFERCRRRYRRRKKASGRSIRLQKTD